MSQTRDSYGTAQPQRLSPLLRPGTLGIDGLSQEALRAFSARFAGLLKFYNAKNREEGSFASFFSSDVEIQLAQIASFRSGAPGRPESLAPTSRSGSSGEGGSEQLAAFLLSLLTTVDQWWRNLSDEVPAVFQLELEQEIRRTLAPVLYRLQDSFPGLSFRASALSPDIWNADAGVKAAAPAKLDLQVVWSVEDSLERLSAAARRSLETAPRQTGLRKPHIALYLAFLQLLEHPRRRMNQLPDRHLRFYYEDVLRQSARGPVPDRVIVSFVPGKQGVPAFLAGGTGLVAGRDALGQDRTYALVSDTVVDRATVERVLTLCVRETPSSSPKGPSHQEVLFGSFSLPPPAPPDPEAPPAPGFPTFGNPEAGAPYANNVTRVDVGFALASPVLRLEGGGRTIEVELSLQLQSSLGGRLPAFTVWMSGTAGWFEAGVTPDWKDETTLRLSIDLLPSDPAVVAYQPTWPGPQFPTASPVLRAVFDPILSEVSAEELAKAVVQQVSITVTVTGSRALSLANSAGPLVAGKPFAPFGLTPPEGAMFLVGCPEAFQKPLTKLALHLCWLNLPAPTPPPPPAPTPAAKPASTPTPPPAPTAVKAAFETYYDGYELALGTTYPSPVYNNGSFLVDMRYRRGGDWANFRTASLSSPSLFVTAGSDGTLQKETILLFESAQPLNVPVASIPEPLAWESLPAAGVLGVRLIAPSYGFGLALYPKAAVALSMLKVEEIIDERNQGTGGGGAPKGASEDGSSKGQGTSTQQGDSSSALPLALNLPYTPTVGDVSLDYTARVVLDATATSGDLSFFHLGMLGAHLAPQGPGLLPAFKNGGSLFLGFSGVRPQAPVSCLFVLQEQKSTAAGGGAPEGISWWYMSSRGWQPLDGPTPGSSATDGSGLVWRGVVADETDGLQRSGLLAFVFPSDAVPWTEQPGELLWIRGQVTQPKAYAATRMLLTQAAWCERVPNPAGDTRYDVPLPPDSVKALAAANPAIAAVKQPLPSSGGRRGEDTSTLHARVSERTRHKARAVTPWDYERLVLQEFPGVFFARCLPRWQLAQGGFSTGAPGSVLMLVSPRVYTPESLTAASYPPGVSASDLESIRVFLVAHAPPSARIQVANPEYQPLTVTCTATAARGQDPLVAGQKLNADLRAFLSPWIFQSEQARSLEGPSSRMEILRFVQARPYLSAVGALSLSSGAGESTRQPWRVRLSAWQHNLSVLRFVG